VAEEEDRTAREALANGYVRTTAVQTNIRVSIPSSNFLGSTFKGGDLDVVAIPYVFRYLCAELASMGIAVSLEVQ
jgi:DNA-directed RNA polymerase I subunit RPA2